MDPGYIEQLMAQYAEQAPPGDSVDNAVQEVSKPETPAPAPTSSQATPQGTDPGAPYGRFKSGRKAGQPRPKPKTVPPGFIPAPAAPPAPEEVKLSGMLIDAGLFIALVDLAVPAAMVMANDLLGGEKVKVKDIQLTTEQKKQLEPIAQKMISELSLKGSPTAMFFLGLILSYGFNFMQAKFFMEETKKS